MEIMLGNPLKASLAISLIVIITGCANSLPEVEHDSLLLDTQAKLLCLNSSVGCRSLDLIVANDKRNEVLQHWPLDRWDWSLLDSSAELTNLLLTPPDNSYIVTPQPNGRYRLSMHPATLDAWRVLDSEFRLRYLEED